MNTIEHANVMTLLVILFAIVGAALVLISAIDTHVAPALQLTFQEYLTRMAVAVGLVGVGRGLAADKSYGKAGPVRHH